MTSSRLFQNMFEESEVWHKSGLVWTFLPGPFWWRGHTKSLVLSDLIHEVYYGLFSSRMLIQLKIWENAVLNPGVPCSFRGTGDFSTCPIKVLSSPCGVLPAKLVNRTCVVLSCNEDGDCKQCWRKSSTSFSMQIRQKRVSGLSSHSTRTLVYPFRHGVLIRCSVCGAHGLILPARYFSQTGILIDGRES